MFGVFTIAGIGKNLYFLQEVIEIVFFLKIKL